MKGKDMIVSQAIEKMIAFYKGSIHDIDHFIKVWSYAKTIGELEGLDAHTQEVLELADVYYDELDKNQDLIRPVYSYADIESNRKAGLMSAMLTVEEGGVCKGNPAFLRTLYRLGVRMLTLTWNFPNELGWPNLEVPGEGVDPESFRPDFRKANVNQGLTETGIAFVQEMERLGMIVDVSHLSDAGFMDVLRVTKKPFVASHSNARAVCSWARNLTDDMIRLLAFELVAAIVLEQNKNRPTLPNMAVWA